MATKFNHSPLSWAAQGIKPPAELASAGWESGYKPPAEYFNYKWNNDYNCINELQNVLKTHADNQSNPHGITKAQLGLGNVDNTADINKEVLSASKLTNAVKINNTAFDGTKDIDISANPTRTALTGSPDLNTILQQGEYYAPYGNTCDNKPKYVRSFALKVYWNMVGSSTTVTQVLFPSHVSIKGYCYIRKSDSTGWSDWKEVCVEGHSHTKSEITDFNIPNFLDTQEGSENVDLNNLTTQGIYCNISGVEYVNAPVTKRTPQGATAGYSFALVVLTSRTASNHSGGYVTQIYYDTWGYAGSYSKMYVRTKNGNNWSDWCSYYNTNNKPTLEDITGSTVLPVSKGGTGFSTISAGYALVGNGTSAQLGTRYINSSVEEKSNDIVTGGAVYNALEKFNTLSKSSYVVAASDSDEILKKYADYVCDGVKDEEEIQKAIDTSPVGSEIKLLAGHYNMNNPIFINKQISLIGSGLNTVITSTRKTVDGLYLMHAIYVNYNGKNVLDGVNISNFKLSRGLCSLNGKFYDGTGSIYTEEFPTYYRSQPLIELGDTDKLKLDYIQFFNKYNNENIDMIRCGSSDSSKEMIEASFILNNCFHSIYNEEFNGYFINFALNNSLSSASSIFVNGCVCTGNLSINLPTQENIKNTIVNSLKTKFYIKGVENKNEN